MYRTDPQPEKTKFQLSKESQKRVWDENIHTNIYQVDNILSFLNRTRNCTEKIVITYMREKIKPVRSVIKVREDGGFEATKIPNPSAT